MRILFISPYNPVPPMFGAATRIYQLLKYLSENHEVTVVSCGKPEDKQVIEKEFPALSKVVMVPVPWRQRYRRLWQFISLFQTESFYYSFVYNKKLEQTLWQLSSETRFDLVQAEFPVMALYKINGSPIRVLDAHNVEFLNFKRMFEKSRFSLRKWFYYREYKLAYHKEVQICKQQNLILTTSEYDREQLDKETPNVAKHVIPNGVEGQYFKPFKTKGEPHAIVFTGMMAYLPNEDGMLHYLRNIHPLVKKKVPDVKVYIVGMKPTKELLSWQSDSVIITGKVEDVRPYVGKASVYIVPLRMGSGTRLKVLEALSMKKPVVTTSLGCEGIDVAHKESVLIADSPQEFADSVIKVMESEQLQNRLAENGFKLVHEKYDWSIVGSKLLEVYRQFEPDKTKNTQDVLNGKKFEKITS